MNLDKNVFVFVSDEPLLLIEACEQVLQQTAALNNTQQSADEKQTIEKQTIEVSEKYDWQNLLADSQSLSLFSQKKLTDIRFAKTPNKQAQQSLVELAKTASEENIFLIRLPKLDKRQKNTQWFKTLTELAFLKELWPPRAHEFKHWISQRAEQMAIALEPQALARLAEQTEGNLLAAKQTLQKLLILYPDETIDLQKLIEISADDARYSVFACLEEALAGNGEKAVKMLHKFQQEAIAPPIILATLSKEISICQQAALAKNKGDFPATALSKFYLWESKKRLILGAVNRLPLMIWQKLMLRCAFLDRMIKGQQTGNVWQEIELCLWMLSGKKIW